MRRSMLMLGLVTLVLGVAAWLAVRDVVMAWESPLADGPAWQDRVVVQNAPIRGVLPEPVRVPDGGNVHLGGLPTVLTVSDPRHEDESTALARQIRELPPGDPKAEELKARLRAVLEKTFAERQATQKKELATLQERLKSLEQTLTRRDALKDQIITRRLEALVDADRELWEDTPGLEPKQIRVRPPNTVPRPVEPQADPGLYPATNDLTVPGDPAALPVPGLPSTAPPSLDPLPPVGPRTDDFAPVPAIGEPPRHLHPSTLVPGTTTPTTPTAPSSPSVNGETPNPPDFDPYAAPRVPGTTSFAPTTTPSAENPNTPVEGRTPPRSAEPSLQQGVSRAMVLSLLRAIERAETDANRANSLQPKGAVSDTERERLQNEHRYQLELLKALRAEADARQKILELSVRKTQLKADGAVAELSRMQELLKRSAISQHEYEKVRLETESAKIDLEKAQLELDEHQKVLKIFPGEQPKADPNLTEDPVPEEPRPKGSLRSSRLPIADFQTVPS